MGAKSRVVLGILVALLVVAAGAGGWLLRGTDDESSSAASSDAGYSIKVGVPTILSPSQLKSFAGDHAPVYWAGERPDTKLEVTLTSKNAIFVRYLPEDEKAGSSKKYLTIGSYDSIDGYAALTAAKRNVATVAQAQQGAVIAVFKNRPLSTYFSFKNGGFQVEVFSPRAGESKRLTDDGTITLVGGTH